MITIRKTAAHELETIEAVVGDSWLHVVDPGADELACLEHDLGIPAEFLRHSLDVHEMARSEKENDVTLIVLRLPYAQEDNADAPYITVPLGIVLVDKFVVTIGKGEAEVIRELVNGQVKDLSTTKRYRFVLHLLFTTAATYLRHLQEINEAVESLEDKLQHSQRNKELLELLRYQKSLVYFTTALKSNQLMMERLQKGHMFEAYPEDAELLEDVMTENHQAIEMTDTASNILSQMMDAFATIISNNLNVVMKFLAAFTVVLTLPTMVASFYGMNVGLPLQNSPQAFLLTLTLSLGLSLAVALIFWKKKWF